MSKAIRPTVLVPLLLVWGTAAALQAGDGTRRLEPGDAAPEFECLDDHGQTWRFRDHVGEKWIILYFYPSDFTFCSTRQATCFRDNLDQLSRLGAEVIGISGDAVSAHQAFKATHHLPFTLLSDGDGRVARSFGVPVRSGGKAVVRNANGQFQFGEDGQLLRIARKVTTARWTFVIDRSGKIAYRDTQASPLEDSKAVLNFLRGAQD